MARTDLEKFKRRLALVDYFRHVFGVKDINSPESVSRFYRTLEDVREGRNAEGRSYIVTGVLEERVRGIDVEDLRRYDANVRRHTESLNRYRREPITLRYFQLLAALMTEHYLDRLTEDAGAFLADLNVFVDEQNDVRPGHKYLPNFDLDDLNKLAFWMATGSGKTLIMHINYYQYLDYAPDIGKNILLVTPRKGLSDQHISEMRKSGIPCRHFNAETSSPSTPDPDTVKVIEITKLTEEKEGEGKSVEVSQLRKDNLVFVDEGHKGAGSKAQAWRKRRSDLAEDGFTFEYSATFGQGVGGTNKDIEEEYGKAILIDYSYPRFYKDGYGKDYHILNLEDPLDPNLTSRYFLANMLTFYEQVRCYEQNRDAFYNDYNVKAPLLTFIGHTVIAGKTRSQLSDTDKESLSDVQEIVFFLHRVLSNEGHWVPKAIDAILAGDAGLLRAEEDSDLFSDAFRTLRQADLDGSTIYDDMLRSVFHVDGPVGLHLVNLKSAKGEIALRAGDADHFFGLINIGDESNFIDRVEDDMEEIAIEPDRVTRSLFHTVNQPNSPINILIGANKFIEGWDSWRVSTMGLMNIGRGEGPQVIQLFGRGVRLLGKDRSLKRSTALTNQQSTPPKHLPLLEMLHIFGLRARYMTKFRDYLAEEGIDTEEWEPVIINTKPGPDFEDRGLLVIRPKTQTLFEQAVTLTLPLDALTPTVDLTARAHELASPALEGKVSASEQEPETRVFSEDVLSLFDWNRLYHDVWRFAHGRGYRNLAIDRETLRGVLEEKNYRLLCREERVTPSSFSDLEQVESTVLMILRKYVERYYINERKRWEYEHISYQVLDQDDDNLITEYEAEVRRSEREFLRTLWEMRDDPKLTEHDNGLPKRVHFDRHLYLPLLLKDVADEPDVKYSPPGLNQGEEGFVKQLRAYVETDEAKDLLATYDCELFLLRNQSRGRGVGFLVDDEGFFPDFILWLVGDARQEIVFVEPHGLFMDRHPERNPKIQFYKEIKDYEQALNARSGYDYVSLHSYVISQTPLAKLGPRFNVDSEAQWNSWHVYFSNQEYATLILQDVLLSGD